MMNSLRVQAVIKASEASRQHALSLANSQLTSLPQCSHAQLFASNASHSTLAIQDYSKCRQCQQTEPSETSRDNFWACLACGEVACGRQQWDGSGGRGHALKHYQATGHPLAIKLGSITKQAKESSLSASSFLNGSPLSGDVHCYVCDELVGVDGNALAEVIPPVLLDQYDCQSSMASQQLAAFQQIKENVLEEGDAIYPSVLATETNDLNDDDCVPFVGLRNLGNSCYLGAVVECLRGMLLSTAKKTANGNKETSLSLKQHSHVYPLKHSECLSCQLRRLFHPATPIASPWMLKALLGGEFAASGRQQDSMELLEHLLQKLLKQPDPACLDIAENFTVFVQESITPISESDDDGSTRRYSPVHSAFNLTLPLPPSNEYPRDDSQSNDDARDVSMASLLTEYFTSAALIEPLPPNLIVQVARYGWDGEKKAPAKNLLGLAPDVMSIDLQPYICPEHEQVDKDNRGEKEVPNGDDDSASPMKQMLVEMGFPEGISTKAASLCPMDFDGAVQVASDLLDQDQNTNPDDNGGRGKEEVDPMETLTAAGFSRQESRRALTRFSNNPQQALQYLLNANAQDNNTTSSASSPTAYDLAAFIVHKGPSMHCGHYIAYYRVTKDKSRRSALQGDGADDEGDCFWVMANDDKVVKVTSEEAVLAAAASAYILFYSQN